MKKSKNAKTSTIRTIATSLQTKHLPILLVILVLAGASLVGAILQQQKSRDLQARIRHQEKIIAMENQACLGIRSLRGTLLPIVRLDASSETPENNPDGIVAKFDCTIGVNTKNLVKGKDVAVVDKEGREMGAEVYYFGTAKQADKFHQAFINPQRYWSVPNESLNSDIPTFKYFTSYVSGTSVYYDAYAIKGNIIMRVTLPCDQTSVETVASCMGDSAQKGDAVETLRLFSESVEPLQF